MVTPLCHHVLRLEKEQVIFTSAPWVIYQCQYDENTRVDE